MAYFLLIPTHHPFVCEEVVARFSHIDAVDFIPISFSYRCFNDIPMRSKSFPKGKGSSARQR